MAIIYLSPYYYKMKLKKCLPKTKNSLFLFSAVIVLCGVYTICEDRAGSMYNQVLPYKSLRRGYYLPLADNKAPKFEDDDETTTRTRITEMSRKINNRQKLITEDPLKRLAQKTIRWPKNLSVWNSNPWEGFNHGRNKRADKRKPVPKLPLRNITIVNGKNTLLVTRKYISKKNNQRQKSRQKWKSRNVHIHAPLISNTMKKNQHKIAPKAHANSAKRKQRRITDLFDIRVQKRVCPIKISHKADIQMLSVVEELDFTPYDGNNVYKEEWKERYSGSKRPEDRTKRKLKVFLVPHTHVDVGWTQTFDFYYVKEVRSILKNLVAKLSEKPDRKFIWAEVIYLARWWEKDATEQEKKDFKRLLNSGQIEIVTGGWVMSDEAVSHWVSSAAQLSAGQQWLMRTLRYRPRHSWDIDPFGLSPSHALLLRRAGIQRATVQRVHYRIKKELARNRHLEFRWRQLYDGSGETDIFTHVLAFNGYDTSNTCGPDKSVCCQFDFRAIGCPSFILSMRNMTSSEEMERSLSRASFTMVDQWRKKAELFRSDVIMVPLGNDMAYTRANEWDTQFKTYEMFMGYINGYKELNTEVKFGTLSDYFDAVDKEKKPTDFPVLSGDFFPYADRWKHYWTGYYSTRPFYKSLDRVVMAYVKAAEIISAMATTQQAVSGAMSTRMSERVERARRALALCQHHDAITGTSRHHVMIDYSNRLLSAILDSQLVIKQAAYFLLGQPPSARSPKIKNKFKSAQEIYFDMDDIWRDPTSLPQRHTMSLTTRTPFQRVVLYNALAFRRTEQLTVVVNTPDVQVFDEEGFAVAVQVSPVVVTTNGNNRLTFARHVYRLTFPVTVGALSLATYTVTLPRKPRKYSTYSQVQTYNLASTDSLGEVFTAEESANAPTKDLVLNAGNSSQLVVSPQGLLKAIVVGKDTFHVDISFVQYTTKSPPKFNSGAYLFIPSGPARPFQPQSASPDIIVTSGPHLTTVYTSLVGLGSAKIFLAISVSNNPSLQQSEVEIWSTVSLVGAAGDIELAMRVDTKIRSGDQFYTDLNGMQMIKRRYFEKLSIQGNWYPLGGAAYLQDDDHRLTLLSSVPLGVASLQSGQIEVMLDRRLRHDDARGLFEPVIDNLPTKYTFKLIHERSNYICKKSASNPALYGELTLGAHVSAQTLLQPLVALHYTPPSRNTWAPRYYAGALLAAADVVVASFRTDVVAMMANGTVIHGMGMTLHRVHLDGCYGNKDIREFYPVGDGQVKLAHLASIKTAQVFESSLTFTTIGPPVHDATVFLCPMDINSVFIKHPVL